MSETTMLKSIRAIIDSKHLNYAEQICEIKLLFHIDDCNKINKYGGLKYDTNRI
jgi:hypothetical protein